jgi:hypothetical protein
MKWEDLRMWRVTTLVTRAAGLSDEQFAAQWLDVLAPAIAVAVRSDKRVRRLVVNVAPETLDEQVSSVFPPPFDGLIEFWFDTGADAVEAMARLSDNDELRSLAAPIVDGGKGVAWLAKVVPSKPEQGSRIKFLAGGDIAEGVTLEFAHKYWAETHPVVAQTAPKVWGPLTRYTQFHGQETPKLDMGRWIAVARFVPMCADMGFARPSDFIGVYTSDEYAAIVRPDEEKFSRPGEMLAFISAEERVLIG